MFVRMRRVMGSDIDVVVVARARRRVAAIAVMPRGEERAPSLPYFFGDDDDGNTER